MFVCDSPARTRYHKKRKVALHPLTGAKKTTQHAHTERQTTEPPETRETQKREFSIPPFAVSLSLSPPWRLTSWRVKMKYLSGEKGWRVGVIPQKGSREQEEREPIELNLNSIHRTEKNDCEGTRARLPQATATIPPFPDLNRETGLKRETKYTRRSDTRSKSYRDR